eukprot:TRINITY_DN2766_c0_g5_i1.p2 TRINITY_DN2766_c0_g5~~TRINITY_DN2766_c0_g5_i1.p2  ORF type:complete len:122 (-),score=26.55 TRINITY_DN2766_c0_g5_i1:33-398(-)
MRWLSVCTLPTWGPARLLLLRRALLRMDLTPSRIVLVDEDRAVVDAALTRAAMDRCAAQLDMAVSPMRHAHDSATAAAEPSVALRAARHGTPQSSILYLRAVAGSAALPPATPYRLSLGKR